MFSLISFVTSFGIVGLGLNYFYLKRLLKERMDGCRGLGV